MQFSPYGSPIPLVFAGYVLSINSNGFPRTETSNDKGGWEKSGFFLDLSVNISKTAADIAKVIIDDNRKSHMSFRLTSRSMTLDGLF